jgi:hypothetical protein
MPSINCVIEKEVNTGGSEANFVDELSCKNKYIKPITKAIMIG